MNTLKGWFNMYNMIIINKFSHTAVAIVDCKTKDLIEYYREVPLQTFMVGNIYKAFVNNVKKGLGGIWLTTNKDGNLFMDVAHIHKDPDKMKMSTYHSNRNELFFEKGDILMAQVIKEGTRIKKPQATTNISLTGALLIMKPFEKSIFASRRFDDNRRRELIDKIKRLSKFDCGYVIRTQCEKCSDEEILREMEWLNKQWEFILKQYEKVAPGDKVYGPNGLLDSIIRDYEFDDELIEVIVSDKRMYDDIKSNDGIAENFKDKMSIAVDNVHISKEYSLAKIIPKLTERKVSLSNGGNIIIDITEALTVIDINTANINTIQNKSKAAYETNKLAIIEIAKILRLRNLSGIILVDIIDMQDKELDDNIINLMKELVKKDKMKIRVEGMTKLGLLEITRQRRHESVSLQMTEECKNCDSTGAVVSDGAIFQIIYDKLVYDILPLKPEETIVMLNEDLLQAYNCSILEKATGLEEFFKENNVKVTKKVIQDNNKFSIVYQ